MAERLPCGCVIAAEWLPDLSTEELRAVLVAVDGYEAAAELHKPVRLHPEYRFKPWCDECSTGLVTFGDDGPFKHRVDWPCRTAQALGMVDPLAPDADPLAREAGEAP